MKVHPPRLPPAITRELEGLPWQWRCGNKHWQLRIDGELVAIWPMGRVRERRTADRKSRFATTSESGDNNMNNDTRNLQQAMQAAADTVAEAQAVQAAPPERTEVEKLLAVADRVLRSQQARMVDAQAAYEQQRIERSNYYRGEMQRLADEAEHELLTIDIQWHATRVQIASIIDKLKAMRGA